MRRSKYLNIGEANPIGVSKSSDSVRDTNTPPADGAQQGEERRHEYASGCNRAQPKLGNGLNQAQRPGQFRGPPAGALTYTVPATGR
jgi:hypothetical protein